MFFPELWHIGCQCNNSCVPVATHMKHIVSLNCEFRELGLFRCVCILKSFWAKKSDQNPKEHILSPKEHTLIVFILKQWNARVRLFSFFYDDLWSLSPETVRVTISSSLILLIQSTTMRSSMRDLHRWVGVFVSINMTVFFLLKSLFLLNPFQYTYFPWYG